MAWSNIRNWDRDLWFVSVFHAPETSHCRYIYLDSRKPCRLYIWVQLANFAHYRSATPRDHWPLDDHWVTWPMQTVELLQSRSRRSLMCVHGRWGRALVSGPRHSATLIPLPHVGRLRRQQQHDQHIVLNDGWHGMPGSVLPQSLIYFDELLCGLSYRQWKKTFGFLHWLASSPLQHSRTTVRVCDSSIAHCLCPSVVISPGLACKGRKRAY